MRNFAFLIIVLIFSFVSCNDNTVRRVKKKNNNKTTEHKIIHNNNENPVSLTVADFKEKAGNLVGRVIIIRGTVDHVCKFGGQKMMLIDENTEKTVKITPDKKIASFKTKLEGEDILVKGIIDEVKVDENYLTDWEQEVQEDLSEKEGKKIKNVEGTEKLGLEKNANDDNIVLRKIEKLLKKLTNSDRKYLSFYSVNCTNYRLIEDSKIKKKQE